MQIKRSRTSQIIPVYVQDSASVIGGGKTGLVYNTATLICYYKRELASSAVAVTLATMTAGTWATGGFKEVDATHQPGMYDFSIPDAAISASDASTWVTVQFTGVSGAFFAPLRIDLVAIDLQDATAAGISRLDAAVTTRLAPTVAARTLDVTATGEAGVDWANVGSPTTTLNLSGTTIKNVTDLSSGGGANVTAINGSATAASNLALSAVSIASGAVAAGTLSTTQLTTNLAETNTDQYVGRVIIFTSGLLVKQAATITAYTSTGGKLTVTELTDAPSAADTFVIV